MPDRPDIDVYIATIRNPAGARIPRDRSPSLLRKKDWPKTLDDL